MNLGLFTHHVPNSTPEEVARQIEAWGFNAVQLYYNFKDLKVEREDLDKATATRLGEAFKNLKVVCIDGFFNPVHPDPAVIKQRLETLQPGFKWAKTIGTDTIGMMTGSYNPNDDWEDHSFNATERALRELAATMKDVTAEAERHGLRICIEPFAFSVVHNPQRMHRLLELVGSERLGYMFDPGAMVGPRVEYCSGEMIREAYELMEDRIWISHFEDIQLSPRGHRYVPMGEGVVDFRAYFDVLRGYEGDLVIEAPGDTREEQRRLILDELSGTPRRG